MNRETLFKKIHLLGYEIKGDFETTFKTLKGREIIFSQVLSNSTFPYANMLVVDLDPYHGDSPSNFEILRFHLEFWENYIKEKDIDVLFVEEDYTESMLIEKGFEKIPKNMLNIFTYFLEEKPRNLCYKEKGTKIKDLIAFFNNVSISLEKTKAKDPAINYTFSENYIHFYFFGVRGKIYYEINQNIILREEETGLIFDLETSSVDELDEYFENIKESIYKNNRLKSLTKPPRTFYLKFISYINNSGEIQNQIHEHLLSKYTARFIENECAKLHANISKNLDEKTIITIEFNSTNIVTLFTIFDFAFLIRVNNGESVKAYLSSELESVLFDLNKQMLENLKKETKIYKEKTS